MALVFAYGLDGDSPGSLKDFTPAQAGDTDATNTSAAAGVYAAHKGDIVAFNDQNRVAGAVVAATSVIGVCEGGNFLGLATGGTYAATSAMTGTNSQKSAIAKVRTAYNAVYRINYTGTDPVIGSSHPFKIVSGDYQLDTADTVGSTKLLKVVDVDTVNKNAFVTIANADRTFS